MREPSTPAGWHPYVEVDCWVDIETYVPKEANPELYAHYRAKLDEQKDRYGQYLDSISPNGDIDSVGEEAYVAEWDMADELIETTPATLAGLLALLIYLHDEALENEPTMIDERIPALISSLAKAAKGIAG